MALTKQLWSISALEVELGRDRRTLGKVLSGVPADGTSGQFDSWHMATVFAALDRYLHPDGRGGVNPAQEKGRKDKELADAAAMKNAALRRELLPREEVDAAVNAFSSRVRSKLLAIPSRTAAIVVQCKTAAEARELISDSINEALEELANTIVAGIPEDASERPGSRRSTKLVHGADAAPEPDGQSMGRSRKKA